MDLERERLRSDVERLSWQSFEDLVRALFRWEYRGSGQFHGNWTRGQDGGADAVFEGMFGGVTAAWYVDAKAYRTPAKLTKEIARVVQDHPGRDYIFVASTMRDHAGKIAALSTWARGLTSPNHTRLVLGKEVVEWAMRWPWVASPWLPDLASRALHAPESPAGVRVPTEPADIREQIARAIKSAPEVYVVGEIGLGQRFIARDVASALNAEGADSPGAVELTTDDPGEVAAVLGRFPEALFVVVIPPGPRAGELVVASRRARPSGRLVAFLSAQQHHAVDLESPGGAVRLNLVRVADELVDELLGTSEWKPGERERWVREARGRAGLVADWVSGGARQVAGALNRDVLAALTVAERRALALIAAWSPAARPTWDAIGAKAGLNGGEMSGLVSKLIGSGVVSAAADGTATMSELDISVLLSRLVDPDLRHAFLDWIEEASGPLPLLRTLDYLGEPAPLRKAARRAPETSEFLQFASEVVGHDPEVDTTLLGALTARTVAVSEREDVASVAARAATFPANAVPACVLVARLSADLPSGPADRIAAQLVDPWRVQDPATVLSALERILDQPGAPELAERAARVWLACGASYNWSTEASLTVGGASWNEQSSVVAAARDAALNLAKGLRQSASVPSQLKGWALAHAIWMEPSGPFMRPDMPDALARGCEAMLEEAQNRLSEPAPWEVWRAIEECTRWLARHDEVDRKKLADTVRAFRRDPLYLWWVSIVEPYDIVADAVVTASRIEAGECWEAWEADHTGSGIPATLRDTILDGLLSAQTGDGSLIEVLDRAWPNVQARLPRDRTVLGAWMDREPERFRRLLTAPTWERLTIGVRILLLDAAPRELVTHVPAADVPAVRSASVSAAQDVAGVLHHPERLDPELVGNLATNVFEVIEPNQRAGFLYRLASHPAAAIRLRALDLLSRSRWGSPLDPSDFASIVGRAIGKNPRAVSEVLRWVRARDHAWLGMARLPVLKLALDQVSKSPVDFNVMETSSAASTLLELDPADWVARLLAADSWYEARVFRPDSVAPADALLALRQLAASFPPEAEVTLRLESVVRPLVHAVDRREIADLIATASAHSPGFAAWLGDQVG